MTITTAGRRQPRTRVLVVRRPKPGHYDGPLTEAGIAARARRLATATAIPPLYRGNPGNCVVIIQKAMALDIPVDTAITNIWWNVDLGKGSATSTLMAAQLRRAGYDFRVTVETTERVRMTFHRDGRRIGPAEWRIEEAVAAGIAWRESWQLYPKDMLWARCLMRGARHLAPEVATGLAYTREELADMEAAAEAGAEAPIHPDVRTLIDEAHTTGTTSDQIKGDITARAKRAKLLHAEAGDGRTLGQVLGEAWMAARAREAEAALALAESAPPAELTDADRPAGAGLAPCGCPFRQLLTTGGQHAEGCRG